MVTFVYTFIRELCIRNICSVINQHFNNINKTIFMKKYFTSLLVTIMLPALSWAQNSMLENNRFFKHSVCNASGAVEGFGTAAAKPVNNTLKSETIIKHKLDSITAYNVWKDKYTYSSDGLFTNMQSWGWDSTISKWVNKSMNEYLYNENKMLSEYYFDYWHVGKKQWITGWKGIYTYNIHKNVTSIVDYRWDTIAKVYVYEWKKEYTYDDNQNMTLKTIMQWDSVAKVWVNEWKEAYTFNSQNKQQTYSADKWNDVTKEWDNIWHENLDYDTNGNALTYLGYAVSSTDGQTYEGWKEIRAYDEKNNLSEYIGYTWDINFKNWTVSWKEEYMYDLSNNKISTVGFSFNESKSEWDSSQKLIYIYDTAIHSNLVLVPYWELGIWKSKINTSTEFAYWKTEERWIEKATVLYSYSPISLAISARNIAEDNEYKIFYSQKNKELKLISPVEATVRILDLSGRSIDSYKINGANSISLSKLLPGSYIATMQSSTNFISETIVVQ